MADRHLRKPGVAREPCDHRFVRRILPRMHEHDRERRVAIALQRGERLPDAQLVRLDLDGSVRAHAFVDFLDARVEQLRQDDLLRKNVRARLIGDAERIAKTACDEERGPPALPLEQRIRGDGGAHFHRADSFGRDLCAGREVQKSPDRLDRSIGVCLRILREQLGNAESTLRIACYDVGKSPAAVDPKIPSTHARSPGRAVRG
jgi:hypothetical protein